MNSDFTYIVVYSTTICVISILYFVMTLDVRNKRKNAFTNDGGGSVIWLKRWRNISADICIPVENRLLWLTNEMILSKKFLTLKKRISCIGVVIEILNFKAKTIKVVARIRDTKGTTRIWKRVRERESKS